MTTRRSCRRGLALAALRTILVSRPELARVFFLAYMTRSDLASLVLHALPKLPRKAMDLPANDVVFRILIENARCPDVTWKLRE